MALAITGFAITGFSSSSASSQRPWSIRARGYELIDLGTLGGQSSSASAVDELGTVAGWSLTDTGARRAFVACDDCGMQDLGTLQNGTDSFATALSDDGEWVAGNSTIRPALDPQNFPAIQQGFVWRDGVMQSVGALYNPATYNRRFGTSEANAVNDQGQVVGFSIVLRQGLESAFLWQDGVMLDIGQANQTAANSRAFDINDSGQVVGEIILEVVDVGEPEAFLWEDGVFRYLENMPGHTSSSAMAINELGQIAGWCGNDTQMSAVVWSGDGVEDLGTLPGDESSQALDVNDWGQVVGRSGAGGQSRAFIWQSGVMVDLNSLLPRKSGWTLVEATDLNNQGMIVGSGLKNGQLRAFLLKPPSRHRRAVR